MITKDDVYITLSGNITFKNTFGYLNAELYPLLNFYITSTVVYVILGCIWGFLLKRYNEYLITIHHFITLLLALGFIESIFMYFEYYIYNVKGQRSFSFIVANILMLAFRTTISLILTLLFSIGYGITTSDVRKYIPKIAMLSFIYFVSNCIYWTVVYINHSTPLSKSILLIISLPISFANSIYSYWILFSLRKTVSNLKESN